MSSSCYITRGICISSSYYANAMVYCHYDMPGLEAHEVYIENGWVCGGINCYDENCPHRFVTATGTVTVTGTVTAKATVTATVTATMTMNRQILLSIWVTPCGAVAQNVRPYHVWLNVSFWWGSTTIRMRVHYQIGTVLRRICLNKDVLYTALNSIRYNAYCKRWTL